MKIALAQREAELLQVPTVAKYQAHLKDVLAYTSVLALLQTPEKKGCVRHQEERRAQRCQAAIDRDRTQRVAAQDLAALLKRSAALQLTAVISDEHSSEEDRTRVRRLIDARRRGDKT